MMERRPRAPVPRSRAAWAMARLAGCVMYIRALLMPNIRSYCFARAFLGFVSTSISSASVSVCKELHASANAGTAEHIGDQRLSAVLNGVGKLPEDTPDGLGSTVEVRAACGSAKCGTQKA